MTTNELCDHIQRTRATVPGQPAAKVYDRLLPRVQDAWRRTGLADAWLIAPAKARLLRVIARGRELDAAERGMVETPAVSERKVAA